MLTGSESRSHCSKAGMMRRVRLWLPVVVLLSSMLFLLAGCGGGETEGDAAPVDASVTGTSVGGDPTRETATVTPASGESGALVAARPYRLVEPEDYNPDEAAPLIIVLHGYGQGEDFGGYFNLDPVAGEHGALVAYPLGTLDALGRRSWNATDACCDFFKRGVDDVAYLSAVIDDVSSRYRVDARRVSVVGYSNGAFMAQRLACDLDARIAAVVAVAEVNWADPALCTPPGRVAVLQVHGDADPVVRFVGGRMLLGTTLAPSVRASIEGWRDRNGCGVAPAILETALDIASNLPGAETTVERYEGCARGSAAELWTVHGGDHDIEFSEAFAAAVWEFLAAHPKP